MLRPLIIIKRIPSIDFMGLHWFGFILSGILTLGSIGLFLVQGLNYGIDFSGGTIMEVHTQGPADLARCARRSTGSASARFSCRGSAGRRKC